MKLILDANISWRLIKKLINYPDSIHINQSKLPQPASDIDIWNFAKKNNYITQISNQKSRLYIFA